MTGNLKKVQFETECSMRTFLLHERIPSHNTFITSGVSNPVSAPKNDADSTVSDPR
jgi:adenosylcobinamide amidohydrolase